MIIRDDRLSIFCSPCDSLARSFSALTLYVGLKQKSSPTWFVYLAEFHEISESPKRYGFRKDGGHNRPTIFENCLVIGVPLHGSDDSKIVCSFSFLYLAMCVIYDSMVVTFFCIKVIFSKRSLSQS